MVGELHRFVHCWFCFLCIKCGMVLFKISFIFYCKWGYIGMVLNNENLDAVF
jgi:hypothetical protein